MARFVATTKSSMYIFWPTTHGTRAGARARASVAAAASRARSWSRTTSGRARTTNSIDSKSGERSSAAWQRATASHWYAKWSFSRYCSEPQVAAP